MRYIKFILIIALLSLFSACDNYLDIVPKGKKIPETLSDYKAFLEPSSITYDTENLQAAGDSRWYRVENNVVGDLSPIFKANFLGDENYDRISKTPSSSLYSSCYKRIVHATTVISEVPDLTDNSSETERAEVIAQARALRAYNYFYLVNVFAKHYQANTAATDPGVVIQFELNFETPYPQKSVQEVYDYILKDLDLAIPHLPKEGTNPFLARKAFGYALQAKVHLFMGDFESAEKSVEESLKLNSSIYNLNNYTSGEVVSYEIDENLFFAEGKGRFPTSDPFNSRISPTVVDKFEAKDIRLTGFFNMPVYIPAGSAMYRQMGPGKFKINDGGMRTTEVYLMKAELLARKGQINLAMDLVNKIRKNRFPEDVNYTLSASNKIDAMNKIMDERLKELILTTNRVWDIRRLALEPDYKIVVEKDLTHLTELNIENKLVRIEPTSSIYIMPFPLEEVDSHGGITQNTK